MAQTVIFSGLAESGVSDLYRVSLPEGQLERLTDDRYQDLDPSLSPDGRRLVFASDRTAGGLDDAVNLFVMDLGTRQIRQLTYGPWVDETPRWVARRSDPLQLRPGWRAQRLFGGHPAARAAGRPRPGPARSMPPRCRGATHSWSAASRTCRSACTSIRPIRWRGRRPSTRGAAAPHSEWSWPTGETGDITASRTPALPPEIHPGFRRRGVRLRAADRHGAGRHLPGERPPQRHLFYFNLTTFQGRQFRSVFENISILGLYLNQTRRLNWGVGAFRFKGNQYAGDFERRLHREHRGRLRAAPLPALPLCADGRAGARSSTPTGSTSPCRWTSRAGSGGSHRSTSPTSTTTRSGPYAGPIDGHRLALTTGIGTRLQQRPLRQLHHHRGREAVSPPRPPERRRPSRPSGSTAAATVPSG